MPGDQGVAGAPPPQPPLPSTIRIYYHRQTTLAESLAFDAKAGRRVPGKGKKASELPGGSVGVCFGTLAMKERRLTSLEGLRLQPGMHTLFLQDNCLLTLEHLGAQPDLQILRLERNLIDDWLGADRCPKLKEVYMDGNPIENKELFHIMACLSLNPALVKVNGRVLSRQEKQLVSLLDRPIMRMALKQGWMLSTTASNTADVDLPVEEFFFRLDPAVEQLLAQGVPAAYCNVNIHHHLRRSYEMLASLKMQPSSSLQQQPKAPKQRPVSKPVSTTSSSHNSPSHNMDTDESCHSVGGRNKQENSIGATHDGASLEQVMVGSSERSYNGRDVGTDFELQDDASGETGQSWAEDADMSGEVLNWKLSSLDFESISPQKGSAVSFDRGNGDVEAQGREKESLALTGFTSNGPEGLLDRKQSDVTRKQQDLKQSQNATNRTSFTKIPRSSNPSIGSGMTDSPEKRTSKSASAATRENFRSRKPPSSDRSSAKDAVMRSAKTPTPPSVPPRDPAPLLPGDDKDEMLSMLKDIRSATMAYADVEPWVVTESPSNARAPAPLSELLSGFADPYPCTSQEKQETLNPSWNRGTGTTPKKGSCSKPLSADAKLESKYSLANSCNARPGGSTGNRAQFGKPFLLAPSKAGPAPKVQGKAPQMSLEAKRYQDDEDVLCARALKVQYPGNIAKLSRTFYGKILLRDVQVWLHDWQSVSVGRQRLRNAAQLRNETSREEAERRVRHDVSIARIQDEAFRVWLLNAAWLMCKRGVGTRIQYRVLRTSICKWKLYVGVLAERHRCFSSVHSQRIAMIQRSISWHKDAICQGGSGGVLMKTSVGTKHHRAMDGALLLFRRSVAACLHENMAAKEHLDERVQLYISHHRAMTTNAFRIWRNFARDIKVIMLTERVQEVEARLSSIVEASLSVSPAKTAVGAVKEPGNWSRDSLEALVDEKLRNSQYFGSWATPSYSLDLRADILDMLLVVASKA